MKRSQQHAWNRHQQAANPFFAQASVHKYRFSTCKQVKLARWPVLARFDKFILIYDSLFILLKSLTLSLHVDIGASISKLVSVHPNFVAWVVLDWWMEI
jgi:hypothetical protein